MSAPCPLCGVVTREYLHAHLPDYAHGSIMRCSGCGHCFSVVTVEPDQAGLYDDKVYRVVENRDSVFDRILGWEYGALVRKLGKLRPAKGELLDFGCGKGKFPWLARQGGWQARAVETAPSRAAYAREVYGLQVSTEYYESGQVFPGVRFDVITMFHVLEHLPQPRALLLRLMEGNLNADGLLVVEVPNIESWQSRIGGARWMHLDVPRHLHHFSPQLVLSLLESVGLRARRVTYWSFHLGVLGMLDALMKKVGGYSGNIIFELKNRRTPGLLARLALVLPVAVVAEAVAAMLGKGGVIRMVLEPQRATVAGHLPSFR